MHSSVRRYRATADLQPEFVETIRHFFQGHLLPFINLAQLDSEPQNPQDVRPPT